MDLNFFRDRNVTNKNFENNSINSFIDELSKALKNMININENKNNQTNEIDEYALYEKKKIFLDNKTRNGNDLAWIMDDNSVCVSENGDGGPVSIDEVDLPVDRKVGEVYEKVDGCYVYNSEITRAVDAIVK